LQYNRARYYDPATGRWMSQDPLGFDAGDSNLYRYAKNTPANATDPSGKDVWIEGGSGWEPPGHFSLCIGDPLGVYKSYSFGVASVFVWVGQVYPDVEKGGEINADFYLKCSPATDKALIQKYDDQIGTEGWYWILGSNCRDWSFEQIGAIQTDFANDVQLAPPPPRVAAAWPGWYVRTITTTTGTTSTGATSTGGGSGSSGSSGASAVP
jgi:hypothetical protein